MIPILFEKSETRFTSNGLGRLVDCIRCEVTEERNGIFECEFEYPVNGRHYEDITLGRVIFCTHDDSRTGQPFDIYKKSAEINGVVTFSASHISYRLGYIVVRPFSAASCSSALSGILENSITDNPFTFWTNKTAYANYEITAPMRAKEILGGVEGSILDVFGTGEYEFDKYTVKLYLHRGTDTDVEIRYSKNLVDLTDEIDFTGTYNAVVPYWISAVDNSMVTLDDYIVYAPNATVTTEPWQDDLGNTITDENETAIDFTYSEVKAMPLDLSEYWINSTPTQAQLKTKAQAILNASEAWLPDENIEIDFVQLWQTPEYESVASLQRVKLCDTVKVIHPALGINLRIKVIKTVYNVLLDRYAGMELGTPQTSFADIVAKNALTQAKAEFMTETQVVSVADRIAHGTSGAFGGSVVTIFDADDHPIETVWMDTDDIETATNVVRANRYGFSISNTGYWGEYKNAWSINGVFNADFIQAGTMTANRIKGGQLLSLNEEMMFDLDSGYYGSSDGNVGIYTKGAKIRFRKATPDPSGEVLSSDIMRIEASINGVPWPDPSGEYYTRYGWIYMPENAPFYIASHQEEGETDTQHIIMQIVPENVSIQNTAKTVFRVFDTAEFTKNVVIRNDTYISGTLRIYPEHNTTDVFSITVGTSSDLKYVLFDRSEIIDKFIFGGSTSYTNYKYRFCGGAAYFDENISCTSVTQRSDERLKNFKKWDDRYDGLLDEIEPSLFTWKSGSDKDKHLGISAQSIQKALKDAGISGSGIVKADLDEDGTETLSVNYNDIMMLMLRKMKQQEQKIATLEARLEALERMILNANT